MLIKSIIYHLPYLIGSISRKLTNLTIKIDTNTKDTASSHKGFRDIDKYTTSYSSSKDSAYKS